MYMIWIWLAVIAIAVVVELIDAGTLVSIWCAVGAVIPFFMSFWRTNNAIYITAQVIVFGIVTALCLIFLRKLALKVLYKNSQEKTNLDTFVNKRVKILNVSEDNTKATVKINGVEYTAVGEDDEQTFTPGQEVYVKRFSGNKVIVYIKEEK